MDDGSDKFAPLTPDEMTDAPGDGRRPPDEGELVSPVPPNAPPPPSRHFNNGGSTATWIYRDANGTELCRILRFDFPDKRKEFCPLTLWRHATGLRWRWKGLPAPRPLYGLEGIADHPDATVIVCEGEKAVDAAAKVFPDHVAVTSPGGSQAAAKADWGPLTGRCVIIWPDNDEPGAKYALEVAAILFGLGCEVALIDAAALVQIDGGKRGAERRIDGWDAADAITEWRDAADLCKSAQGLAKPFDPSPLKGLVERVVADPGAAFVPEVLERLAALKKEDRAAFELLRSKLKKSDCRVTALDKAIAKESGDAGGRGPTHADILIELAQTAELFHNPDGRGFADLDINGHRETWPIRAIGFRRWLTRRFYEETGGAPSSEALQSALNVVEAKAHFDAPERVVHVRVGGLDGRLYLDLGDERWRAVEIDATGWRIKENPPVRFRRASGMLPLPMPVQGGSVESLRSFLNVKSETDFVLVVAWALACLRDRGPYPIIALSGEQGSAKSTFSAILRALLDPNTAPLRAMPREDRDLFIAASNGHLLVFDNVSDLPAWISDMLCRLATGAGFAVRQLYTDQDEVLFNAARPVILNGIEDIVTRPDLADRALFLTLEPIPEERRRPEAELWAAFEAERPRLLGVLLDAVVEGLKRQPKTRLPKLPRMADFALWATACETALWPKGKFWAAYTANLGEAVESVIDADPVAAAVRAMMQARTAWTGNATDLLDALGEVVGERIAKSKSWPGSPRALSGRLRRAATVLRKIGIEIGFYRDEGRVRARIITVTTIGDRAPESEGVRPSTPSAQSSSDLRSNASNGFTAAPLRTVGEDADGRAQGKDLTVRANPLKSNDGNGADGADANLPAQSGQPRTSATRWSARI